MPSGTSLAMVVIARAALQFVGKVGGYRLLLLANSSFRRPFLNVVLADARERLQRKRIENWSLLAASAKDAFSDYPELHRLAMRKLLSTMPTRSKRIDGV
jgi:hypothetical protein